MSKIKNVFLNGKKVITNWRKARVIFPENFYVETYLLKRKNVKIY